MPDQLQAAVYDGSLEHPSYYRRHLDAYARAKSSARNPRRCTCILYLNAEGWDVGRDGGALRVYHPPDGERHLDVAPLCGRLLLFDSTTIEHEVRHTYSQRWALTLWAEIPQD